MSKKIHYPSYYVIDKKERGKRKKEAILSLLTRRQRWGFLSPDEGDTLLALCTLIVGDGREELLSYIVFHIDQTLMESIGETERRQYVPKEKRLISNGLKIIEKLAQRQFGKKFQDLEEIYQQQIFNEMSCSLDQTNQAFSHKIQTLSLEAYYSHLI